MLIPTAGTPGFWVEFRLVMTELQNLKSSKHVDSLIYTGPLSRDEEAKRDQKIAYLEEKMALLENAHRLFQEKRDQRATVNPCGLAQG